jgi:GT2 family glycosyltransferase
LDAGFDLVGPVTNAPGHAPWQHVLPFCHPHKPSLDDGEDRIDQVVAAITEKSVGPIEAPINGFFMMAKTSTWWKHAFNKRNVFDPRYPLVRNEVELQDRWREAGGRIGFVPQSYIFHYRSVSRPDGLKGKSGRGAYRPPNFMR